MSRGERHSKLTRVSISLLGIVEATLLKKTLGREGPSSPRIRIFSLLAILMFVFFVTLLPLIMDNTRWVLSVHPDLFSSPPPFFPRGSSRAFWVCRGWLFPPTIGCSSRCVSCFSPRSTYLLFLHIRIVIPFSIRSAFPYPLLRTSPCITSCTPATPYLRHHLPDDLPPSPNFPYILSLRFHLCA